MGTALPDDNYPMRRFFFNPVCNRLILRYFCRWCSWRWCPNEEGIKTLVLLELANGQLALEVVP